MSVADIFNKMEYPQRAVAITPADGTDLPDSAIVVVTVAGNLAVHDAVGTPITFTALPAGYIVPFQVRRVLATGTTASAAYLY